MEGVTAQAARVLEEGRYGQARRGTPRLLRNKAPPVACDEEEAVSVDGLFRFRAPCLYPLPLLLA